MLPKAILFDLDDTILCHDAVCDPAWEKVCRDFCKDTGLLAAEELLGSITEVKEWYWGSAERHRSGRLDLLQARREIVRMALEKLKIAEEPHVLQIADGYTHLQEEMIHPFPDAVETLEALQEKGVRMALLTNGSAAAQRRKIERFNLARFFEVILIEGELGFGKPDPRVFSMALAALNIQARDTWMVGDNLAWEVAVPQSLGITAIWNDHDRRGLPKDSNIVPDRIIHSIAELLTAFTLPPV